MATIFLGSFFVHAISINLKDDTYNYRKTSISTSIEAPVWNIGNAWYFSGQFDFDNGIFSIKRDMDSAELRVLEITNDEYKISLSGTLDADLRVLGIPAGSIKDGTMDGFSYMNKDTLAIKHSDLYTEGIYNPLGVKVKINAFLEMIPPFDFFHFPIHDGEEWTESSVGSFLGNIEVVGFINQDITGGDNFSYDKITCTHIGDFTVTAGTFDTYLVKGTSSVQNGQLKMWYSPEVGNIIKVYLKIHDWQGFNAYFDAELTSTNFIKDNHPPDIPDKPNAPNSGNTDDSITFSTSTIDSDGDKIKYGWDWNGDNKVDEWSSLKDSGVTDSRSHTWNKQGVYNVKVKAQDESGIESLWSDPLAVTITSENPTVSMVVHKFSNKNMDDIDCDIPFGEDETPPEWFYKAEAYSSDNLVLSKTESNRKSNGDWIQNYNWTPNHQIDFEIDNYMIDISLKLMDHDGVIEGGCDDLADISGCGYPDGFGRNDNTDYKRGAVYHGIYNLATDSLEPCSSNPDDYSDFFVREDGYFKTCGDFSPDNTVGVEDFLSSENDACAWFDLWDNYDKPELSAGVIDEGKLREDVGVRFSGSVVGGYPDYVWYWDFGDGFYSNDQNPVHVFENTGKFTVSLSLTDGLGFKVSDTFVLDIEENIKPGTPSRPSGSVSGKVGSSYTYYSSCVDSEGDLLYYKWDFGDGSFSKWLGPYSSGERVSASHSWNGQGSFSVCVKAVDDPNRDGDFSDGKMSSWSEPLSVSMPKEKSSEKLFDSIFLDEIFSNYFHFFSFVYNLFS